MCWEFRSNIKSTQITRLKFQPHRCLPDFSETGKPEEEDRILNGLFETRSLWKSWEAYREQNFDVGWANYRYVEILALTRLKLFTYVKFSLENFVSEIILLSVNIKIHNASFLMTQKYFDYQMISSSSETYGLRFWNFFSEK